MKKDYKNLLFILLFVFVLGISINVYADTVSCTGVFAPDFLKALKDYVYYPVKALSVVILILLTSIDFAKVVFGGKKEEMDKAKNNFLKRSVAALIIFFAPNVIELIVDLVQKQSISSCLNNLK